MKTLKISLIYRAVVNRKEYKDLFVIEYDNKRKYILDITTGQPIKNDISVGIEVNKTVEKELYSGEYKDINFKEITKVYFYEKEKLILIHGTNKCDIYVDYINNKIYENKTISNKNDYVLIYEPNIFNNKLDKHLFDDVFSAKVKIVDKNIFVRSMDNKDIGVCFSLKDYDKLVNNILDIFDYFNNKTLSEIEGILNNKSISYSMVEFR